MLTLGTFEREKDIRSIWPDEARDFTPWLCQPPNIALLEKELGLGELEKVQAEVNLSGFRLDLLAESSHGIVAIENQFGPSDHKHLGQLVTYLASLDPNLPRNAIWIAEHIRDEHRKALDWLNEKPGQSVQFFGVELEVWRIDNSNAAVRFNVVSKPNSFANQVAATTIAWTPGEVVSSEFWKVVAGKLIERGAKAGTPYKRWLRIGIGNGCSLRMRTFAGSDTIRFSVDMEGDDASDIYKYLSSKRSQIESSFGKPLNWPGQEGQTQNMRSIRYEISGINLEKRENWGEYSQRVAATIERLMATFQPVLNSFTNHGVIS